MIFLIVALLGPDNIVGFAAPADEFRSSHFVMVPDSGEPFLAYVWPAILVRHESDEFRGEAITIPDIEGRRVRITKTEDGIQAITLLGGMNPRDFGFLAAQCDLINAARPSGPDDALATIGLGHRLYAVREAAAGVLERRGTASIPALIRAASHHDPEVSIRSRAILAAIRDGN